MQGVVYFQQQRYIQNIEKQTKKNWKIKMKNISIQNIYFDRLLTTPHLHAGF